MNRPAFLMPALLTLALLAPAARAQSADTAAELETLTVSGEQPGPGLWALRHGDHSLWMLATVAPVPKDLKWRSRQLEAVIARSQVVIAPPVVDLDASEIGFFQKISMVATLVKSAVLPGKQTLADVLPPALAARWSTLRQRYAPRSKSLDSARPLFAGIVLNEKAMERAGLDANRDLWEDVRKLAKRHKTTLREPQILLPLKDPKALLAEFASTPPAADVPCLDAVLARLETQLPQLQQQGVAWATGDIETLLRLPPDPLDGACLIGITGTPRLAALYQEGLRRWRLEWVLAAEGALLRNTSSLAVLPLEEVIGPQGLVTQMVARGYTLVEPQH